MATSQTEPATTVAAASETIIGWHMFRIEGFSATKDLGVGKSIKSDTFRVGGHEWYIECYPCGDDEERADWVTIGLCSQDDHPNADVVKTCCQFTLMESLKDGCSKRLDGHPSKWVTLKGDDEHSRPCINFIERKKLELLLKDDHIQVRCVVLIKKLPAVAQPDLDTEIMSGSHMLTVNGYTNTMREPAVNHIIGSSTFDVGGHDWQIEFYPWGEDENNADSITTYLFLKDPAANNELKVRFKMALLTHSGQMISSIQDFYTFSDRSQKYLCKFLSRMKHESLSLLQHGIRIRCDMAIVQGILEVQPPPNLGLGTDVTIEVGGDLFSAHKCVLATRSTVFMAKFFGPAGKENTADVTQVLRIDDMEPRVFKALRHFIYTDALPEVPEEDKVVLAQYLLAAADRYALERLKLICADMLCIHINATTAVATLELADKHGCLKLKEACIKVIRDWLTKVALSLLDPCN